MNEAVVGYTDEGEHPCERLVRIIQGREGIVSKERREQACIELLDMFRPFIIKVASETFRRFQQFIFQDYQTWYQDTISTMIELVLADYIPKKYGGEAMFGPYLRSKLFLRRYYAGQVCERTLKRETIVDTRIFTIGESNFNQRQEFHTDFQNDMSLEIKRAVYAHMIDDDGSSFDRLMHQELWQRIESTFQIAKRVLEPVEFYVWYHAIFSEKTIEQIMKTNPHPSLDGKNHTKQKVYNLFQRARKKVLLAYAKDQIAGRV